jgi:hypothetical protein
LKVAPDAALSRFEREIHDPEKARKGSETPGLMGVSAKVFLHSGPKFRSNDHGDAGESAT